MNIATVVSVCGHDKYFDLASISIPSFLKNCPDADLFVFTDNIKKIKSIGGKNPRFHVEDFNFLYNKYYNKIDFINNYIPKNFKNMKYYNYVHDHIKVAAVLPMANFYLQDKYSHILKIDIDGYWVGNVLNKLITEEESVINENDVLLVERRSLLMVRITKYRPGVGFTLWKSSSKFIELYLQNFIGTEQETIWRITGCKWGKFHELLIKQLKFHLLKRPGYHFVYPFTCNKDFNKEQASEFIPAYFHCGGQDVYEQLRTLERWFG